MLTAQPLSRRPAAPAPRRPAIGPGDGPPAPPPSAPRRVTVMGDGARLDLALPARCTTAELMPALVRALGAGGDPAGWALHRLGGQVLPAERTVAAAGLTDGEILHLLPTGYPAAEAVFDDMIDAVAENVGAAPGRWRPAWSRRVALAAAVAAFSGAAVAGSIGVRPAGPLVAVLAVVLLLTAGVLLARRGAPAVGAALAGAGMPGLLAAALTGPVVPGLAGTPGRLVVAGAGLAVYALLAAALLAGYRVWFVAATGAATIGTVAVGSAIAGGFAPDAVAAVLMVLAVLLTPAFPALSLRLAALPVPEVPADMAAFRAAEQPTPAGEVAGRTRTAQLALTALLSATALIVVVTGAVLLSGPNRLGWLLTGLGGVALLVRSRAYPAASQRAALLAGGAVLVPVAAAVACAAGTLPPPALAAAALLAGVGCTTHALRAGRRAPSPYWGRLLDVVDFAAATALVPAAAAVLGLYGSAQAITG